MLYYYSISQAEKDKDITKDDTKDMQDDFQEAMRMMVQTQLHLEAAMGRNVGNTLSGAHPEALHETVDHMAHTFKVPYSLYEISLRFVCLYDQLVAT